MSAEKTNAERLEQLYSTFEEEGFAATAEVAEAIFHPEVEFNPLAAGDAGGRTYRGRDGMLAFFGELNEAYEEVRYEPPQFHPVGDELVIAFTRMVGVARETGLPMRQDLPLVYEFNGEGQVMCVTAHETAADALEAAERGHADA